MTSATESYGVLATPRALFGELSHRLRVLRARPQVSYLLVMGLTGALVTVGLVFVLSASSVRSFEFHGTTTWFLMRQGMWATGGLIVMLIVARLPMKVFRFLSLPALIISFLMLIAVPIFGATRYGAQRWIDFGSIQLQPSEFAKIALILWCADVLVRKEELLADIKHLLIPVLPVLGVIGLLVMEEPDMGTTTVLVLIVVTILWVVGTPGRIFLRMGGIIVAGAALLAVVEPYRFERVTSFVDPFKDQTDTGYQAVQGFYALSSGGWFGVGLGGSREKWSGLLPNAHTDFIFAVVGEETGFIGCLVLLGLFVALAMTGVRIARRTQDPYARLVAAGCTAWLVGQAVINIATVVGVLPITGIPLPFISYGGTSLVLTMAAAGMLAACARTEPGAQRILATTSRLSTRKRRERAAARPENVVPLPPKGKGAKRPGQTRSPQTRSGQSRTTQSRSTQARTSGNARVAGKPRGGGGGGQRTTRARPR